MNSSLYFWLPLAVSLWLVPNSSYLIHDYSLAQNQTDDGRRDFDFLLGKKWNVLNKVRKERLKGSEEWEEFIATLSDGRKIVDGLGNIDKFYGYRHGQYFEGNSIRIFNPSDSTWTIHWVDNVSATLSYQVRGKFNKRRGIFYGEENYQGKMVKLRFIWDYFSPSSARWEQAYWDHSKQQWELNWIMEFSISS